MRRLYSNYFILELLTVPPGFSRGLLFDEDGCTVISDDNRFKDVIQNENLEEKKINLMDLVQQEQNIFGNFTDIIYFLIEMLNVLFKQVCGMKENLLKQTKKKN